MLGKQCFFCSQNTRAIDYKDAELLKRFLTPQAKIVSSKRTGICPKHQRRLSLAVKRARYMALLPYTPR